MKKWLRTDNLEANSSRLTARGALERAFRGSLAPGDGCYWNIDFVKPLLIVVSLLFVAGCDRPINGEYGQRTGPGASASVNGTAVFSKMFEQAGHRVSSWDALTPRLMKKADCIVWFPDDFEPPKPEVREWLWDWLMAESDRTLIYVGRDFDAEPWYWEHVLPGAPPEKLAAIRNRLAVTRRAYELAREKLPKSEDCDWFELDSSVPLRQIRSLEGDFAWLEGVDATGIEIELRSRLSPSEAAEVLLKSGDDAIVSREYCDLGRLIVVANGSFLLNLPLVNHEHRKLAAQLIAEIGPAGQKVVFLESHAGGPPIREDRSTAMFNGMEVFNVWPTNWILLHLAVLGIIFCFLRWPIFGRPWEPPVAGASDFGRHVDALADLLKRSHDRDYAVSRVLNYRQKTEPEK